MNKIKQPGDAVDRFGLGREAIYRLWKTAIKNDDPLVDEALRATYERMVHVDRALTEKM